MAGVGFDAAMIRDADDLKDRIGRAAYLVSGSRHLRQKPFEAAIDVDGAEWFSGSATCILVGNVGELFGGVEVFPDAASRRRPARARRLHRRRPRAMGAHARAHRPGRPEPRRRSSARRRRARVKVGLDRKVLYELDGGDRKKVKSFKVKIEPRRAESLRAARPTGRGVVDGKRQARPAAGRRARRRPRARTSRGPSSSSGWRARASSPAASSTGSSAILAVKVALGAGGETTDQQGALKTIAGQPFGKVLLVLVAIGLAGYALWRLVRAAIGHGPETGEDDAKDRISGVVSGIAYAALCVTAVKILIGSSSSSSSSKTEKATGGVLDWPLGRYLVIVAGLVVLGVAVDQALKGIKQKFLEDSKTEQMSPGVDQAFTAVGVVGHLARAVVFALIGWFVIKAAIDYDPDKAVGLDQALAKLSSSAFGPVVLGIVAAGLIAFACYSVLDARYRRV